MEGGLVAGVALINTTVISKRHTPNCATQNYKVRIRIRIRNERNERGSAQLPMARALMDGWVGGGGGVWRRLVWWLVSHGTRGSGRSQFARRHFRSLCMCGGYMDGTTTLHCGGEGGGERAFVCVCVVLEEGLRLCGFVSVVG